MRKKAAEARCVARGSMMETDWTLNAEWGVRADDADTTPV